MSVTKKQESQQLTIPDIPGYTCLFIESETRLFQKLIILWKLRGIRIPHTIMLIKSDASFRVTDLFLGVLHVSRWL